ncbi:hypothetical protein [Sporichthya sp.]|uniref:hypothetical protein n=1 Tax=Sporichthya sp. TaxID=65475 RepID=UPI0025D87072|nr:hypothetical protein [Sporichthya sp.]
MTDPMGFDETTSRRLEAAYLSPELIAQRRASLDMVGCGKASASSTWGPGPGFSP